MLKLTCSFFWVKNNMLKLLILKQNYHQHLFEAFNLPTLIWNWLMFEFVYQRLSYCFDCTNWSNNLLTYMATYPPEKSYWLLFEWVDSTIYHVNLKSLQRVEIIDLIRNHQLFFKITGSISINLWSLCYQLLHKITNSIWVAEHLLFDCFKST